jgi:Mrp family chromosome partitioning ATPase
VDLSNYVRILRLRWRVVATCVVLGLFAGWISSPGSQPGETSGQRYQATAILFSDTADPDQRAQELARAKLLLSDSPELARTVAQNVPAAAGAVTNADDLAIEVDSPAAALTISATNRSADTAKAVAQGYADALVAKMKADSDNLSDLERARLQGQLKDQGTKLNQISAQLAANPGNPDLVEQQTSLRGTSASLQEQLSALDRRAAPLRVQEKPVPVALPAPPGRFSAPSSLGQRLLIGLFLGFLLGAGLALLLDRVDTRLRTRSAIQDAFRLPVVGELPQLPKRERRGEHVIAAEHPDSAAAESYRSLRSAVLNLPITRVGTRFGGAEPADDGRADPPTVVLVTSPRRGEGKTTTVVNLAACLAETGRSVLVLDCDLRNPAVHRYLRTGRDEGLSDLLVVGVDRGTELVLQDSWIVDRDLERVIQPSPIPGISVATAGTKVYHPAALLSKLGSIIGAARRHADVVLIDAPPLLTANDAIEIVPYVDTVLMVSRAGATTAEHAERASDALARIQAPVTGVALITSGRQFAGADTDADGSGSWRRLASWLVSGTTTPARDQGTALVRSGAHSDDPDGIDSPTVAIDPRSVNGHDPHPAPKRRYDMP